MPKKTFGAELSEKRHAKAMTIRGVEKATGISNAAVSLYENDRFVRSMSLIHAYKLCRLFGWEIGDFVEKAIASEANILPARPNKRKPKDAPQKAS